MVSAGLSVQRDTLVWAVTLGGSKMLLRPQFCGAPLSCNRTILLGANRKVYLQPSLDRIPLHVTSYTCESSKCVSTHLVSYSSLETFH